MQKVRFKETDVIIRQGDRGDKFYVLESGTCDISVKGKGTVMKASRGVAFGELALMFNQPRAATVTAEGDVTAWQVTFRQDPNPKPHLTCSLTRESKKAWRARTCQVDDVTFKAILMANWKPPVFSKSAEVESLLTAAFENNILMKELALCDRVVRLAPSPPHPRIFNLSLAPS